MKLNQPNENSSICLPAAYHEFKALIADRLTDNDLKLFVMIMPQK